MSWMDNMSAEERQAWLEAGTMADRKWDNMKRQRQDPPMTLRQQLLDKQNEMALTLL